MATPIPDPAKKENPVKAKRKTNVVIMSKLDGAKSLFGIENKSVDQATAPKKPVADQPVFLGSDGVVYDLNYVPMNPADYLAQAKIPLFNPQNTRCTGVVRAQEVPAQHTKGLRLYQNSPKSSAISKSRHR